jgi:hypothetical protein
MIDWSKGFSASYYASVVDPVLWKDIERFEITDGSVACSEDGLRTSADITCTEFNPAAETWVRIWLEANQSENAQKVALFTGLASVPSINIDGVRREYPLECYSVLKPASDMLLQRGWYAPVATSGDVLIKRLLEVTPAPVVVEGEAPRLGNAIIAEEGETHLSMVDRILEAMNWRLVVRGDGSIHIGAKSAVPVATFDALSNDVVEPKVTYTSDWFSCPNVFRAIMEDVVAVARDDSETSFLSTVTRGREIWMEEDGCDLNAGETLGEYAIRRLKEEQSYGTSISYTRRFNPDINVSDLVTLHYPAQGLQGNYIVTSQNISLGHGAKVSEEVRA